MQKLTIENFLAIRSAEFCVDEVVLLIGEQASGKSTVAKVIHFFKRLRSDFFQFVWNLAESITASNPSASHLECEFADEIGRKFLRYFGVPSSHREGLLTYYYTYSKSVRIELSPDHSLRVVFSDDLAQALFSKLPEILMLWQEREDQLQAREDSPGLPIDQIEVIINSAFEDTRVSRFIPAFRGIAVLVPEQLKLTFFGNLSAEVREQELEQESGLYLPLVDWYLMREFFERAERNREVFTRTFADFVKSPKALREPAHQQIMEVALDRISHILKGEYQYDRKNERIYFGENEFVDLRNASSGQQEVIRILQDVFLSLLHKRAGCCVIEEPEVHLYPMAQKKLIELITLMLNSTKSQVILTTHSPYILSVYNNLLYATRVAELSPSAHDEIAETIPESCWLDPGRFYAYALKDGFSQSIIDQETGLIDQNFLDDISEELGSEFNILYQIRAEAF